jgi:hypothetical protein
MSDVGPGERLELRVMYEPEFVHKLVWGFGAIGVCAGLGGVIIGVAMTLHRVVAPCPDGHEFPLGGDPNCYSHPNAGLGTSIALVSVALSALILLVATTLLLLVASRRRRF